MANLLAVVNSGRVTVAELAARLKGVPAENTAPSAASAPAEGLLAIRWEELGSVAYDLWFILAVTVAVIVVARPIGWLVKRAQGRA